MDAPRQDRGRLPLGYLVVLSGSVGFVVGCFLPLYRIPFVHGRIFTLYNQIVDGLGAPLSHRLSGGLFLFAGVATVGTISILACAEALTDRLGALSSAPSRCGPSRWSAS
ncbi:MAG: hypothetical protein ACRDMH_17170 [Solirubrobacterales bacterium]